MMKQATLVLALSLPLPRASAQDACELQAIERPGTRFFGGALQVTGPEAFVADYGFANDTGRVFLYHKGSEGWTSGQRLDPPDTGGPIYFGRSLLHRGDLLFVGAPFANDGQPDAGAVYVYERGVNAWQFRQKLLAPPPNVQQSALFGWSLAHEPGLLVVGATFEPAAYVFTQEPDGTWVFDERIAPPNPVGANDRFGSSMALEGTRLIIGDSSADTPNGQHDTGDAFYYERASGSFAFVEELPGPGGASGGAFQRFGEQVALSGDWAVVAQPGFAFPDQGRVFVNQRVGGTWVQTQVLEPDAEGPDGFRAQDFGSSLALFDERLFVGAPADDSAVENSGAAYVFELQGQTWVRVQKLSSAEGESFTAFGNALARDGDTLWVGSTDKASVFSLQPTTESYCTTNANSTGAPGAISASPACPSVSGGTLQLRATPVPDTAGLFFYGTTRVQVPFGDGARCTGGAIQRLPVQFASGGELAYDLALSGAAGVEAGVTRNFQAWFRDSAAGGAGFNLSNAVALTFGL